MAASRWEARDHGGRTATFARATASFTTTEPTSRTLTRFATRPTHGGRDNFEITPAANCDRGIDPACNHANTLRLDRCGNEFIRTSSTRREPSATPGPGSRSDATTGARCSRASRSASWSPWTHNSAGSCNITRITFEDWQLLPACDAPVGNLSCVENAGRARHHVDESAERQHGRRHPGQRRPLHDRSGYVDEREHPRSAFPAGQISSVDIINSEHRGRHVRLPAVREPGRLREELAHPGPARQAGRCISEMTRSSSTS